MHVWGEFEAVTNYNPLFGIQIWPDFGQRIRLTEIIFNCQNFLEDFFFIEIKDNQMCDKFGSLFTKIWLKTG